MNAINLEGMPDVKILAGSKLINPAPNTPFHEEVCSYLDALSRNLRKDPRAKSFPDVVSFAFWCRKANVSHEKAIRFDCLRNRLGRGLAFHIAPSNVPVNFAFTFAFSLLAGNSTIVRVPTKRFLQVDIIAHAMKSAFKEFPDIASRSAIIQYPSSSSTTEMLSALSDVRVIWGGDATVQTIREFRSKPRCVDIAFADRYSIALINASEIIKLEDASLQKLAKGFYNDTYLMDQNACSSPQTILWVGSNETTKEAKKRFWDAVLIEAKKSYNLQAAVAVDKHVQLASDVIRGTVLNPREYDGFLTTVELHDDVTLSTAFRGVGGYFYEKSIDNITEISNSIDERFQTLVQFGFDSVELQNQLLNQRCMGIDRIVPIGDALNIGLIWDGYDLVDAMSRIINIQG